MARNLRTKNVLLNISKLRSFSSAISNASELQLVRDYIDNSLYNSSVGYFSETKGKVVGEFETPIDFKNLGGPYEYKELLRRFYKELDKSWLTPVEIFKPWYGFALGEYIIRKHNNVKPLKVYEVGGGTGTCALNIMQYMQENFPQVYEDMEYVSVEVSKKLANRQLARIKSNGTTCHSKNYKQFLGNAMNCNTWGKKDAEPCFVILNEVLDNLPHDRVVLSKPGGVWMETRIKSAQGKLHEVLMPLKDPLCVRCLDVVQRTKVTLSLNSFFNLSRKQQVMWIPTGLMALLETLHSVRPNMTLIISDFSSLPDVTIEGENAPLVASKAGFIQIQDNGVTHDHNTYLVPSGTADIFFPTNFRLLEALDHYCSQKAANLPRTSTIVSTATFMREMGQFEQTVTRDGYNPLLQDFLNTKFYLSTPKA